MNGRPFIAAFAATASAAAHGAAAQRARIWRIGFLPDSLRVRVDEGTE